jgi:predicted Zn-dependent protease with MMP-like domain
MTYDLFRQTVETMLSEIPEEFLEGLQGVHVLETTKLEPDLGDVYRLGEYLDPGQDSFLGGNPGLGRHITLYYGSFVTIAKGHSDFDWEEEIWETLVHELRHHVESLAGDASLIAEDQRRDATFRKQLGKK